MSIFLEFHAESLLVLPLLGVALGECENPKCEAEHWMVSIGWLLWTAEILIEF